MGSIDGVEAPISLTTVKQALCAGGFQEIVFGPNNEVHSLSTENRFFNQAQRRAITARDGGCTIPACTVPAAWCEIHHVTPWYRGGKTNIGNGVLLCWYHHHSIDTSGWDIRMNRGTPEIRAPYCYDPTRTWQAASQNRASGPAGQGVLPSGSRRSQPPAT